VRDACLSLRDNTLGLNSYKDFVCPAATSTSAATCAAAFATAPADAIVTAATAAPPLGSSAQTPYDAGQVCGNAEAGFIYVYNMCDTPARLTFELRTRAHGGGLDPKNLCVTVLGKKLSGVAVAVCVAAAVVGIFVLGLVCCCLRRCCCR
jgi:hypothetical protein